MLLISRRVPMNFLFLAIVFGLSIQSCGKKKEDDDDDDIIRSCEVPSTQDEDFSYCWDIYNASATDSKSACNKLSGEYSAKQCDVTTKTTYCGFKNANGVYFRQWYTGEDWDDELIEASCDENKGEVAKNLQVKTPQR